jgi:hypothetical protein
MRLLLLTMFVLVLGMLRAEPSSDYKTFCLRFDTDC